MKMGPSFVFWEIERIIENSHPIRYPELIRSQRSLY